MDVTDFIGRFGPWQRRTLLVMLYRGIPLAFVILNAQFFVPNVDYWCAREDFNSSVEEWRSCCVPSNSHCEKYVFDQGVSTNETVKCDAWEFDSKDYGPNIKEEWSLVCDRSWLISMTYALLKLGNFLSYIPSGHLADRYGRKVVCLTGMGSIVVFGVIGYFSPNIEFFLVLRFLTGVAYGLFQSTSLCLFVEAVGPEYRSLMSLSFLGSSGAGMMLLAAVASVTKDWRTLQLVGFVPIALISPLLIWRFVPETPRWLLSAGKYSEAEKVIMEAAKMNGIEILDKEGIMKELKAKVEEEKKSEESKKRATLFDLFRTATLRKMTIILWLTLLLIGFIITGFTLTVSQLGGSLHLNYFLIGLTETVSTGILLLQGKYMRRRRALLINLVISGIAFFAAIAIPDSLEWLRISVAILGKTCVTLAYTLLWLFAAEIFPTNLRVVGVCGGMTTGRLGNVVASFMDELGRKSGKNVPIAIYGSLSVLTSVLFLLLPETKDQHLPDTVKESERLKETMDAHK